MNRRRLLVAALVFFAGCNALAPGGPGEEASTTPSLTPVAVPTETPGTTETESVVEPTMFPGVGPNGVLDTPALVEAHVDYLESTSYTYVQYSRGTAMRGDPEPFTYEASRWVAVENETTYRLAMNGSGTPPDVTEYADPSGRYRQVRHDNGSTEVVTLPRRPGAATAWFAERGVIRLTGFLFDGRPGGRIVERDGERYVRFREDSAPPVLVGLYERLAVRNYTAVLYVAPEGYVRSLYYRYDLVGDDQRVTIEWAALYRDVGETTVRPPDWFSEVERAAGTVTGPATVGVGTAATPVGTETSVPAGTETSVPAGTGTGGTEVGHSASGNRSRSPVPGSSTTAYGVSGAASIGSPPGLIRTVPPRSSWTYSWVCPWKT